MGVKGDKVAEVPVGGVDFAASSFIAPWDIKVVYTFGTKENPTQHNQNAPEDKRIVMPPYEVREGGIWYWLTYNTLPEAVAAQDLLDPSDDKIKPSAQWHIETHAAEVLNNGDLEALANAFGVVMDFDVPIKGLAGSENFEAVHRHEYQLLSLPYAVQAAALAMGYIEKEIFHAEELTAEGADVDGWTEQQYIDYVGDPKGTDIWQSTLGERRRALWLALGEENVKAYTCIGTMTPNGKSEAKTNTVSAQLDECLRFVLGIERESRVYGRLLMVPDPRPKATYGPEHKRLSVACLSEIFGPELPEVRELAASVGAEEIAERGGNKAASHPQLPENWTGAHDLFVAELRKAGRDKPAPVIVAEVYADSVELLAEWWQYMDDNNLWSE